MQNDNFIKDFLFENLIEKRRTRRWNIFFKLFFLSCIFFLLYYVSKNSQIYNAKNADHVAVIEINGVISDKNHSNAKNIITSLNEAFENKNAKAVILKINSPGGTPVQASIIHNHIKKLRKFNSAKPIYSVIEDIGTSGAYLIAIAAEKVYCDPSSIVGSIGVLINSFGFVGAIDKLGIERRIYKAGKNKVIMDPFLEKNLDDEKILQHDLDIIHEIFSNFVKKNRYPDSISFDQDIFSGRFWIGKEALSIGLVDGFYDVYSLSYDVIKVNSLIDYNYNSNIFNILEKNMKN